MRAVILSQRLLAHEAHAEVRDCLDVRWASLLGAAGLVPIPAPSGVDTAVLLELVRPAGVLLTGGNDLGSISGAPLDRARDQLELALLALARQAGLPVFGVCRGAQLLAWEAGARIVPLVGHVRTTHALSVEGDGHACRQLAALGRVNSYHGFGVTEVPAETHAVLARSEDGVVEAFGNRGSGRELGIMWHPERYDTPRAPEVALLRRHFDGEGEP